LNMRTFLTLCLVAAAMAQGGVPHLPSYGEPNTVYCYHREDPTDHKCYEACATTDFNSTGITQPGTCNPAVFKITETTKKVNACSDGVTNLKYCVGGSLVKVTITFKTKGESAFAMTAPASSFVHAIVTSPGDHCLEVTIPGGNDSPFWKSEGWKYSAPVRPEWKSGACDRTAWKTVDSTQPDYDGYTTAKNSPYGSVVLNKYGRGNAMMDAVAPMADAIQCGQGSDNEKIMLVNKLRPSMKFRMCTRPVDPKTGWACNHGTSFIDCDRHIKQSELVELDLGQQIETVLPLTFTSTGAVDMVSECYWKRPAAGWPKTTITIDQAWWDALQKSCMTVYGN